MDETGQIVHRSGSFEVTDTRALSEGDGSLTGYILKFNDLNSHGEILLPGCTTATKDEFLRSGFCPDSHNWESVGELTGIPTDLTEDAEGALSTFQFHSTDTAQRVRTVVRERTEKKKSVGLSIGFSWGSDAYYVCPSDYDKVLPGLFRKDKLAELMARARQFSRIRVIPTVKLYEFSVVTAPSQGNASVTQVRSTSDTMKTSLLQKAIRASIPADPQTDEQKSIARILTAVADSPVEVRSGVLGDMNCSALYVMDYIYSSLMYCALYPTVWDANIDTATKIQLCQEAIEEFSELSSALIASILTTLDALNMEDEEAEQMQEDGMRNMSRYVLPPNDFDSGKSLGLTLESHTRLALSAVTSVTERLSALAQKRSQHPEFRVGQEFSAKNKSNLETCKVELTKVVERIDGMLGVDVEETEDRSKENAIKSRIRTRALLEDSSDLIPVGQ